MIHCGFDKSSAMANVTPVQNIFLIEYMPKAPEDYCKVYLYGLMLCGCRALEGTDMAFALGMEEGKVVEALLYWQDRGLLRIEGEDPIVVEYANPMMIPASVSGDRQYARLVEALRSAAGSRVFTPQELSRIYDWVEIFGMEEAAAIMLVRYCMDKKGARVRIQYMDKTAKTWANDGILTAEAAEERIRRDTELQGGAMDILKRWRKGRMATEDELNMYRRWTEEWKLSHEEILAACPAVAAADKPTFAYLNGVLEGMRAGGGVQQYLKDTAMVEELAREAFVRSGIKRAATRREKEQLSQWALGWHMDTEIILLAAEYSAGSSRPMEQMKRLIEGWRQQGINTLSGARAAYEGQRNVQPQGKQSPQPHFMNYEQRRYSSEELERLIEPLDEDD